MSENVIIRVEILKSPLQLIDPNAIIYLPLLYTSTSHIVRESKKLYIPTNHNFLIIRNIKHLERSIFNARYA